MVGARPNMRTRQGPSVHKDASAEYSDCQTCLSVLVPQFCVARQSIEVDVVFMIPNFLSSQTRHSGKHKGQVKRIRRARSPENGQAISLSRPACHHSGSVRNQFYTCRWGADGRDAGMRLKAEHDRLGREVALVQAPPNCTINADGEFPVITYEWRNGAPPRTCINKEGASVSVKKAFSVAGNHWVQIESNGRFSCRDFGIWFYEHEIINVAFTDPVNRAIFTTTEPAETYQQLADLW